MTPSQRARCAYEARDGKWRNTDPPVPSLKHAGGQPQPWPLHPHPKVQVLKSHFPPPPPPRSHLPFFHTRHAEESAERPRLVTIVRPCGQSTLRKVTVLLNRRGVVSFEQLLLDISEALGFPRWHRARVTRLYTTHAREVRGVCDFFRGDVAFLALGKARPDLISVQEALEELFPEHSDFCADALRAWEKRLRPAPDKAAKADSGYSEGTDSSETQTKQESGHDTNIHVKNKTNTDANTKLSHHVETQQPEKSQKKNSSRKPAHRPNHLQKLCVRGGVRTRAPSVIGPFKHEVILREADILAPNLCENCLARRAKHQAPERLNGKVPLPPLSRKQKGSCHTEQEVRKVYVHISPSSTPPPPQPIGKEEKVIPQLQLLSPLPNVGETFNLPSDGSDVTLTDIERCYEIGRVVGDGNFAVVRECHRRDNGQPLAVKIIERSKLIGREHMMQNELSLLGSLCHPRIVRLFAHHHTSSHSYLVMELVSGGDLFEAISERGKFPEAEAGVMVSDVSEALNFIHCKSIVHRDLKPENLLIERVGADICRLKLGDFGLAMVVTEPVFTICGTPTYVAPEILCESGYGVAVDVWALGVILYILLCGFPPFRSRDRDQEELFQLIKQGQIHFLSPYWDPISEEARGLVRALLQSDPTVRLTAQQTLLHPWVKAMVSTCRQGELSDKTQRCKAAAGAGPDRDQGHVQTNPAEADTEETPRRSISDGKIPHEEISERQADINAGKGEEMQQKTSAVNKISSQFKVHTMSVVTPDQQRPESPAETPDGGHSRLEKQDESPCETGLGDELSKLSDPKDQTEPSAEIKGPSSPTSQEQENNRDL
ncbi:serine/threonine-protein kinase DCLK3 [Cheilinus undulatus]|uniref:serine/threonine-protein kinase DCLK3 n=1 Tax=Cheilinus undulatus TaxID=241271 RepID=UPI001BD692F7|nr:serine/threonine-protein kinase DCLK3 [Cheilinus undulatus]